MTLGRLCSLVRSDVTQPWDRWTSTFLAACVALLAIEELQCCRRTLGCDGSLACLFGSFFLLGLAAATAIVLLRRGVARILPALLLLAVVALGRAEIALALTWLLLLFVLLVSLLIGIAARLLGK